MAPNSTAAAMNDVGGERLEDLDRKRLMELCKKNGIKCKGKNVDLVDKLKAFYISSSTTTIPSSPISVDCNDAYNAAIAESKEEEAGKKECQNEEKEQQSPLQKSSSSSPLKRFRDSPLKCNPITLSLNDTPSKLGSPMRKRQSTQIGGSPAIRKITTPLPNHIESSVTMPVIQRPKYIAPHERVALMAKENLLKKQQRLKELQEKDQLKPMATTITTTMNATATTTATASKKTFNLQQSLERNNNSSSTTTYTPHKGKLKPFSL